MNSRQKGAEGERELSKMLRDYGYETRRGQQYSGADGSADVVGLPGIHIECKRVERLDLYGAVGQSVRDSAAAGDPHPLPAVFHRRNRADWLVTMRLGDWIKLYQAWERGQLN